MIKLPPLRHPPERGMAAEGAHRGRQQAEADGAAAVAGVDAIDQRRQFLAPVAGGFEQIRLVLTAGTMSSCTTPALSDL